MSHQHDGTAARITALEAVVSDMLAFAAEDRPSLRFVLQQRLTRIAENFEDMEATDVAESVEAIRDDFMRSP